MNSSQSKKSHGPNWTRPLGLASLLVAIGSGAYWLEYGHKPKKESEEENQKRIFNFKESAVESISIGQGDRVFSFKCLDVEQKLCKSGDQSRWEMTAPVKLRADDSNVNSLLSTLHNWVAQESISLESEPEAKRVDLLKEYGLSDELKKSPDRPTISATIGGKTVQAWIGTINPIGGDSEYVSTSTEPLKVRIMPNTLKTTIAKDLTYWRDKKIMSLTASEIQAIDLENPKGKLSLSRKDSSWVIQPLGQKSAPEVQGDLENIDNLISAAIYMTAKNFVSETKTGPIANQALQGSKTEVSITLYRSIDRKDGITVLLRSKLGKPTTPLGQRGVTTIQKTVYVTSSASDPLFEVDASIPSRLDKGLKELRLSRLISSVDRFSTQEILFSQSKLFEKEIRLLNRESKWVIDSQGGIEADPDKVNQVLDKVSGNRIQDFLNQAPAGQDEGITVTLKDGGGKIRKQLVFWKKGDLVYARDLGDQKAGVFQVDTAIWASLPQKATHFEAKPKDPKATPAPGSDASESM
jgi:hypothetical protein